MRALGLESVQQLDDLLAVPISQWAADHSESPDEEYELADRMISHDTDTVFRVSDVTVV